MAPYNTNQPLRDTWCLLLPLPSRRPEGALNLTGLVSAAAEPILITISVSFGGSFSDSFYYLNLLL